MASRWLALGLVAAVSCLSCKKDENGATGGKPPIATSSATAAPAPPPSAIPADRSCSVDADCILVAADCCDCANGGANTAVRASTAQDYRTARAQRCAAAETACIAMIGVDMSCAPDARATCQSGTCAVTGPKKP